MSLPSAFRDRRLLAVGAFTLLYLIIASLIAISYGNWEFVFYILIVFILGGIALAMHPRVRFSPGVFWGLSIWGLLHMIGGLVQVPASWPIEGEKAVVYSWWIIPHTLKADNVIHAYGFAIATWVCWQALKAGARLTRPSFGLLALCALAGMGLGATNEIIEYIAKVTMDTNVGGYDNTLWDIIWNAIGSTAAVTLIGLSYARQTPSVPDDPAAIISLVAHHLKTPVAQLQLYVQTLLAGDLGKLTAKQKEYVGDMATIARHNGEMVENLLLASRLQRGLLQPVCKGVRVSDVLAVLEQRYAALAHSKNVRFQVVAHGAMGVRADPDMLQEALARVVANAIAFTERGVVTVSAERADGGVRIVVADTGPGIPSDVAERLRVPPSGMHAEAREGGGLGMGLPIARQLIDLQGGRMTVASSDQSGSAITFWLPQATVE